MNPSFHRLYHLIRFGIGLGLRPINSSGGLVDCLHGDECDGSSRLVAKGTPLWGIDECYFRKINPLPRYGDAWVRMFGHGKSPKRAVMIDAISLSICVLWPGPTMESFL